MNSHTYPRFKRILYPALIWCLHIIMAATTMIMFTRIIHPRPGPGKYGYLWSWDGAYYLHIAASGYSNIQSSAFFPLYPILIRLFHAATHISYTYSGVIVANLCFLLALLALFQLVLEKADVAVAKRTLWLLMVFPTAMFFNCTYSESVNLLTLVLFFYCLQKDHWYLAMLCGFLATIAHDLGVLLVFSGLVYLWIRRHELSNKTIAIRIISLVIIPLSLVLYMLHLYHHFGDPTLFLQAAKQGWNKRIGIPIYFVFESLVHLYHHPNIPWNTPTIMVINGVFTIIMMLMGVLMLTRYRKQITAEQQVFFWITLLASITPNNHNTLESFARYMVVLFPGFIVWAYCCKKEWLFLTSITLMLPIKVILLGMFVNWYWIT